MNIIGHNRNDKGHVRTQPDNGTSPGQTMSVLGLVVRVVIGRLRPNSQAMSCCYHIHTDCGNPSSPAVTTISATTSYSSHRLCADESQTAGDMVTGRRALQSLPTAAGKSHGAKQQKPEKEQPWDATP
ncbi:hypothetical protein CGRA01v4_11476 [Colletotrichum graminicola]|nr:hypothetical protein CGRA01v4_11476 [Colletotrichum graminicola]